MAILSLVAAKSRATKKQPYNKKQAILTFTRKYKKQFEMKDDAIDLREMSENYPNKIIPVEDIHQAIQTVLGPRYAFAPAPFDPSGGAIIQYPNQSTSPRFEYVKWKDLYLWPIFQRDVAPNHVAKIIEDFEHTAVIVPCAIKLTIKDEKGNPKTIYCIWDGHHTTQVCHFMNYTLYPVWVIDIDHVPVNQIENAGFGPTDEDRIAYGVWLAGTNMRRINSKNKRPLSPYDDFMIGYETKDKQFVDMMNILRKNTCVPKRHATCGGAFTQIKSGIECFEYADMYGNRGIYWDRALKVHRDTWPASHLVLEVFRPLTMLYHQAATQGIVLDAKFDIELAKMLVKHWGHAEGVQEGIKASYWNAYHDTSGKNKLTGNIPEHDKERVLAGIINFYKQNGGKTILPTPSCQWKV
jgi:hypothetical protein